MKKGIIIVALASVFLAGVTRAEEIEVSNGWVGFLNANPKLYDPYDLRDAGTMMTGADREKIAEADGIWRQWTETGNYEYDYVMVTFPDPGDAERAILQWQVGIDHDDHVVTLLYWHGTNYSWVNLATNDGGRTPPTEYTDVIAAFNNNPPETECVIFLFVGVTQEEGDDYIQCDVCDMARKP